MACLTREKSQYYRLHWKFTISAGPQAGKLMEGSQYLGRCTQAAAKTRLRELEDWEEAVKAGRHLPNGGWEGVYELWLREKELSCTPQTVLRARQVLTLYVRWREAVRNRQDGTLKMTQQRVVKAHRSSSPQSPPTVAPSQPSSDCSYDCLGPGAMPGDENRSGPAQGVV